MNKYFTKIISPFFIMLFIMLFIFPFDSKADNNCFFEIRMAHPNNESLQSQKNIPPNYEKFKNAPNNWPYYVFVSKKVELDITCLEKASIGKVLDKLGTEKPDRAILIPAERILNEPQIVLKFNKKGTKIFSQLTKDHLNERLAIILDGKLLTAPLILEAIDEGEARITNPLSYEETETIIKRINYMISVCNPK